ncbi:hypothetical protein MRX96_001225 [Rhipicephalus microplus]
MGGSAGPKHKTAISMAIADIMVPKQRQPKKLKEKENLLERSSKKPEVARCGLVANRLDSSAPSKKRGKERETPARRKLSVMKKIIIKEREDRRQRREKLRLLTAARQGCLANSASEVVVELDPATENNEEIGLQDTPLSRIEPNSEAQPESPEINKTTKALLADLVFYQDRLYQKDPIKARSKRRLVYGLKEVRKYLLLNKLKCIVFRPGHRGGGLDHSLRDMIDYARAHFVPIVFALRRRHLGTLAKKNVPVSCVGIFDYSAREAQFKELLELSPSPLGEYAAKDDSASVGVVLDDGWVTANEESDAEDFENSLTTVDASKNLDSLARLLALTLRSAGRES